MSAATLVNTCAACGAEESLDALLARMIDDIEVRNLIADVIGMSLPLGRQVLRYLRLHKPPKHRLSMVKVRGLLVELVPDLMRNVIERKGRTWLAPQAVWAEAFESLFDAAAKGTLDLPLTGHAYLYEIVMRKADRGEAQAEEQRELDRRSAPRQDTVTVRGQSLPIGEALQVAYGGKDAALAKIDADAQRAVPMPEEVRKRLDAIKRGSTP